MELLKQKTGVDLTFISYRGASAAAADVLAGHLPLCIANIDSLMGQVNAGKLKPIASHRRQALAGGARHADLRRSGLSRPRRHLVVDLGGAGRHAGQGQGEAARPRTEQALQSPDVIESMRQGGFEPGAMPVRRGRCLHQDRVQALGRGHPCRGHPAAIGISSPTCWRPASTWCSAAPRPVPPRSRRAPTMPIPATPSGRRCTPSA